MSVYEDIASDAGYAYGTDENRMLAMMIEQQEMAEFHRQMEERSYMENYYEILFRDFKNEGEIK